MKNELNELSSFQREVTTLALTSVKTFNVDTLINICNATGNFDVAVLMLLNKYEEPKLPLKGIMPISNDKLLTVCTLLRYDPFKNSVHYSYYKYCRAYDDKAKGYVITSEIIKDEYFCTYEVWMKAVERFDNYTPSEDVELLNQ